MVSDVPGLPEQVLLIPLNVSCAIEEILGLCEGLDAVALAINHLLTPDTRNTLGGYIYDVRSALHDLEATYPIQTKSIRSTKR